jgi:hypothetical protein
MTHPLRRSVVGIALTALMTACTGGGATPAASATARPSESAAPTQTPGPSAPPSEGPSEAATPEASEPETGFQVAPHTEADSLFLDRDECEDVDAGFRVQYPDAWWTNTPTGDTDGCTWYAPTSFEVDDPEEVPNGVVISIEIVPEDVYSDESSPSRVDGIIGETQAAARVDDGDEYVYLVQLGPPGQGPTLVARTAAEMGGDYELNKAVLDRIMATMEFIGTVE